MELELPDLVEWNEKWKKEIDDLVGKSDLYITQDDLLFDELENKLQYVPDNEFNDKLRQKDTDEAVLTWAKTGNYDRGQPLSYAEIIQGQAQSELINWIWANNKELLMLADCHFIGNVWDYLDWKMPEMDGIETARQIRKRICKEITIIVLTSYEFSEIEEEAKAAGIDAFIAKPLFRSRLTATLRQFTSGKTEKTARNYLEELAKADYTGKRILLVEDNELNREIAVEILQMTGAEVETAENGKIAVEKVEASPKSSYDLIFMDIQMPVMNGYEATAAIRSLPGEKGKLPIVAMTANAFAEDVQLAKNTGMNGHIAKPLDMNKLNDVLENWL